MQFDTKTSGLRPRGWSASRRTLTGTTFRLSRLPAAGACRAAWHVAYSSLGSPTARMGRRWPTTRSPHLLDDEAITSVA